MKKIISRTLAFVCAMLMFCNMNAQDKLLWDYTETAPSSTSDNGLTMESKVNDAAGTKNGLKGVKMNSSGFAYFTKSAVKGTLKLSFGPRDPGKSLCLSVYTYASNPGKETFIKKTDVVSEVQTVSIDLTAEQNNIYICRGEGSEGVLTKIEFAPYVERTFKDFEMVLGGLSAEYDASALPSGVEFSGTYNSDGHGYRNAVISVPVDGTVKFTYSSCTYGNQKFSVKNADGEVVASNLELSLGENSCYHQNGNNVLEYIYTGKPTTLTFGPIQYLAYFKAEATEVAPCVVTFKDQNGKVIGTVNKFEGDCLGEIPYTVEDIPIFSESEEFRGWVYASGVKAKDSDVLSGNTTISALVTRYEMVSEGSVQNYPFTSNIYYPEDHETISIEGGYYHDGQHGWAMADNGKIRLNVAGNAQVVLSLCVFSKDAAITVTDGNGNLVETITSGMVENDGATATVNYKGERTELIFTWAKGESYIHSITVYNVRDFVEKDTETDYYIVPANDGAGFLLALNAANNEDGAKIFLPNGTYDLGETVNTTISGKNMSIIGQGLVTIKNAPDVKLEGLGKADLLCNTSDGLYMHEITLKNALDYYAAGSAGRACSFHDKGNHTACYDVILDSYQDTYYSHKDGAYTYWNKGSIMGTVDYICGSGNVFFDSVSLVNRSREATDGKGECTISAPYTAEADKGYVFQNCAVTTNSNSFNFGRSWNEAKCAFLNTTLLKDNIASSRWTAKGMNSSAVSFKEYNTVDTNGKVISPASNKIKFTHSTGDREYETILTAEEAEGYSYENFFKGANWDPRSIVKQEEAVVKSATTSNLTMDAEGTYLLEEESDAEFFKIFVGKSLDYSFDATHKYTVRKANARGGFGVATQLNFDTTSVKSVSENEKSSTCYNLAGIQVSGAGQEIVIKNGKKYLNK